LVPTEQELQSTYYEYFAELATKEMEIEKEKEGKQISIGSKITSLQEGIEELKKGQEDIKKDIHEKHKEILDMLDHIKEAINDVLPQKEGGEKQSQESLEKNKAPSSSLELLDASLELIDVGGK